jgi:hypothetical protein
MARHRRAQEAVLNLFPMFNILVATLGVLVFILFAVVVLSVGLGKTVSLGIAGSPRHDRREPIYLEWTGREIVLHPAARAVTLDRDIHQIKTWRDTYAYLDGAIRGSEIEALFAGTPEERAKRYVVVLVRPSGFSNFLDLREYLTSKGIGFGYEPVDHNWIIRLR